MPKVDQHIPQHTEKGLLSGPKNLVRAFQANKEYALNYPKYIDTGLPTSDRQKLDAQIPKTIEWYNPKQLDFIGSAVSENIPPSFKSDPPNIEWFGWETMTEQIKKLTAEELKQLEDSSRYLSAIMNGSKEWSPEKAMIPHLLTLAFLASNKDSARYEQDKQFIQARLRKVKSDVKLTDIPSNSPRIEHLDTIAKHVAVVMQAYLKKGGLVSSPEQFATSLKEYDFRHPDLYNPIAPYIAVDLLIENSPNNQKKLDEIIAMGVETSNPSFNKSDYLADLALAPDREIAASEIPPDNALLARQNADEWIDSTLTRFRESLNDYFDSSGIFNKKGMELLCKATLQRIGLTMENGSLGMKILTPQPFTLRDINEILDQFSSIPNKDKPTPLQFKLTNSQRKSILEAIAVSLSIYSKDMASKKMYPDAERARAIAILTMSHLKDIK